MRVRYAVEQYGHTCRLPGLGAAISAVHRSRRVCVDDDGAFTGPHPCLYQRPDGRVDDDALCATAVRSLPRATPDTLR